MTKRALPIRRIIGEIRGGLGDVPIMEKYGLSPEEYIEILENLKGQRIRQPPGELEQPSEAEVRRKPAQRRAVPRCYMVFNRSISDVDNPGVKGIVVDISERGVQITGIETRVGEVRTFVIGNDRFSPDSELGFEAVCRWFNPGDASGECMAGFEIARISAAARNRLRKLLQELTFCEVGFP